MGAEKNTAIMIICPRKSEMVLKDRLFIKHRRGVHENSH
jgi:hypothetical protein